ncbi:MAG TPA: hypothetical protein VF707_06080 [Ardenticatenaceae bacterium]
MATFPPSDKAKWSREWLRRCSDGASGEIPGGQRELPAFLFDDRRWTTNDR